jgi:hypothetical protein
MSSWSSYKIELIGTGEQAGTWGTTTNNNFQYAIEQAIGGYVTQALTTTSTTLSLTNTNALQNARALFIQFTGSPGTGATVVLPSIQKLYFIKNAITTYDLIVKTSTSATVTVPNGNTACIYVNGTDVIGTNDWLPSLATTTITASGAVTVSGALTANANTTLGTSGTAVTGVSYTISGTNAVFSSGFSLASAFSVGDYVTVDFASGSGVDGRYQVASSPTPTTTTFALVGAVPSGSTTGTGSFYKSNRITNYADFYTAGGTGTSGQILTSQGTDQPPTWSSLTSVSSLTISGALTANGNSTFGSTAVTSGTYSRSLATITVTATAHGFSTGQVLYLNFTTGVATSGIYSITVVDANTFTVTDTVNTTGSSSGNVSLTKYNNSFTLQSPITSFGSTGSSGQFFVSQGAGAPPQWITLNSLSSLSLSGALSVSGATTLNGNNTVGSTSVTSGTYARSLATITVTSTAHGFSTGQALYLNFTSGVATSGNYSITVTGANTFTVTDTVNTTGTSSGNVTINKYNNTFSLNSPIVLPDVYGSAGTSGYALLSQGSGLPPTWSSLSSAISSLSLSGTLAVSGSSTLSGNNTFGSTAVTSGTYSRSLATITVTATAHGFSTGQVLYLSFTTGTATTGVYSITVVNANTFTVTDTVNTTGSSSGNVTITKYNNSFTLQSPVTSFGGNGTVGQFFTSQGDGAPPQWTTLSSLSNLSLTGNLTVAGSTTNNGTTTNNGNTTIGSITASTATYSRSSATITITSTAHGFSTGQVLYLNFTTGVATTGVYSITVVNANTFTVTDAVNTTGSSSGNVSITKYNNTLSVNSPIVVPTEFGSSGTSGYVLVSQGVNAPPKWSDAASAISSLSLSGTLTVAGASTFNGNSSFGSTTAISGSFSYTKTTTAVTISGSGFNFSASDYVWIIFSGGSMSGLDGVYQLATATSTQLTFSYSSSGTTGGTVTSITKYNNNVTLQAPISAFNGYGNSAQFLSSQGSNAPPKWLTLAGGGSVTVSTSGSTTTISTSTQISSALYVITGATYAYATDATYTITKVSHGIPSGAYVSLVFSASSGSAPPNGNYLVSNVTANTFDISASAIAGDAGNCATGTALQFGSSYNLSIPTWAKKLTVMFVGVSTSSTGTKIIQIGTGGSPETSGYLGAGGQTSGSAAATTNYTTGFGIRSSAAADILHGSVDISFASANYWVANGVVSKSDAAISYQTSGSKSLAGALDTVVITTTGTDVFDSGFVAIQYQ